MGRTTLYSGLIALAFPIVMLWIKKIIHGGEKWHYIKTTVFLLCVAVMLYFTLGGRTSSERKINMTPFWTYSYFSDPQYRWEIYMNVFLFLPFGFMLPFAMKRNLRQTLLIGFLFSVFIEMIQYIFYLGLCEFDDVFHNSLGTLLGYSYWKALTRLKIIYG